MEGHRQEREKMENGGLYLPLKPPVRKLVTWVANCSRYVAVAGFPNDMLSQ